MLYIYGKRACNFWGYIYLYFSLVFYILGAFLAKHLFHSRLLDMRLVIPNARSWNLLSGDWDQAPGISKINYKY